MVVPEAPRRHLFSPWAVLAWGLAAAGLFAALAVYVGGTAEAAEPGASAAVASPAPQRAGSAAMAKVDPEGYTSARVCGQCHADIYNSWKNSLHAFSLSDPVFDTAFMQALKEGGEDAKRLCLRCHAPMTQANDDFDLEQGVTREGVSCDFCHTVKTVDMKNAERPFTLEPGLVKRSVLKDADSPAHKVAYSELHTTSEICGGCHNYVTANGTAIMSTYDEWRQGPYATEGVNCQNCHMVLSRGKIYAQQAGEESPGIHLHNLIHDSNQLRSALAVRIVHAERTGTGLEVQVEVENVGSGHKVPTGLPTREIVLTVSVEAGTRTLDKEIRYRKVVADERYRPLKSDHEVFLNGAKILSDNRIGPKEKRIERVTFDLRRTSAPAKVTATLSYKYAVMVLKPHRMDVKLGTAERYIR